MTPEEVKDAIARRNALLAAVLPRLAVATNGGELLTPMQVAERAVAIADALGELEEDCE